MTYTIKELGARFGLPASTLRYYEEVGLLKQVGRTPEHQRVYEEQHLRRLESICCFKGTGMTIPQMRELFGYIEGGAAHVDEILALLEAQREKTQRQIVEMQTNLAHVERKIRRYAAMKAAAEGKEA
ncbi:MerR family transcriptional regulator [uncultured Oscillibacter sp.]|uniref:MerR family transcriptional regulator n=1 Tax=uncultured Oscillibacter sp. TaxID=876091 RepID=UPI0025E37B46|nr:MerR family transcriptional regulator [uncultured Oscillibacter sp.]